MLKSPQSKRFARSVWTAAVNRRSGKRNFQLTVAGTGSLYAMTRDAVRQAMQTTIHFTLNGRPRTVTTDSDRSLLEVLREDLQLTGTKYGCGEGQCRACTVLINGHSTASCMTSIGDVDQQEVLTIEGLATADRLHPVQEAFLAEGAFQCGYCTAGMILGVVGALKENPKATAAEIIPQMQRHLCRCGSYAKYIKAIGRAVAQTGKAGA